MGAHLEGWQVWIVMIGFAGGALFACVIVGALFWAFVSAAFDWWRRRK
jgi:hypothetical protein